MEGGDRNAVQERIKKMVELKKSLKQRESGEFSKRLKSGTGLKEEGGSQLTHPHSSKRLKRPVSAMKPVESHNTITTATQSRPQIDLRPYLKHAFGYGAKVKELLKQKQLSAQEWHNRLASNSLFTVKTVSRLQGQPQQSYPELVEQMVLQKLNRLLAVSSQQKKCDEAQERLNRKLQDRIKSLHSMIPNNK